MPVVRLPRTGDFPVPGRSIDTDHNGVIGTTEGRLATGMRTIVQGRHTLEQTAIDILQLVREIQAGVDVDGDGHPDLDASRIYYFGWSEGGGLGALLLPVEPAIRAGALVAIGGRPAPWLSPSSRGAVGQFLAARVPSLLDPPGTSVISVFHGVPVVGPFFNEDASCSIGTICSLRTSRSPIRTASS